MDLPYKDALIFKRNAALNHLGKLMTPTYMSADGEHFIAVNNAAKHNQKLIDEMTGIKGRNGQ